VRVPPLFLCGGQVGILIEGLPENVDKKESSRLCQGREERELKIPQIDIASSSSVDLTSATAGGFSD
jgi:hypothetical protein